MARPRAPGRFYVIIDGDDGGVLSWCLSRKEATTECRRYNKLAGYEPNCRVVEYRAVLPESDDAD